MCRVVVGCVGLMVAANRHPQRNVGLQCGCNDNELQESHDRRNAADRKLRHLRYWGMGLAGELMKAVRV